MKKRKGFSMMEILIVVGIISAIISTVGFVATTMLTNSRREACWGNIKNIETAAIAFYSFNTYYPDEISQLGSFLSNLVLTCPVNSSALYTTGDAAQTDFDTNGKLTAETRTNHNHGSTIPF